ncbi:PHD finger protein 20-like isoform X2 [Varroa jacobsoni]|uniref:PHD finger protein 20-like isoform X2 n=1 Tax=Varroa jacobsoni TaxID=62625 RepID=UPI000BF62DE0|nr:PHD finger protein 20-like isoform X2 [Varroa jacobsoni]
MARRGELHTVRVTGEQSKRHRGRPRKKSLRGSCTLDKAAPPSANVGKRHSRDAPDPSVSETVRKLRLALVKPPNVSTMNDTLVSAHEDLEAHVKMDSSEPTCELHRTRGVAKRDKWARNIGNKASTKDPKPTLSDVTWLSSKPYISSKARRISNEKEETIRNKRKISTGQENGLCTEVEQHRKESKQPRSVVAKQKKSKKVDLKVDTQMAQQKVQPNDSNAVELDIVHCVCGTTSRDGMIMQCDSCSAWQHGKCFGVTDPTTLPSRYLCQACVNGRRVWASHSYKQAAFRTLSDGSPADETYGRLAAEAVDAARVQWAMDACETVLRKSERETEIRHPPIIIGKDDTGIQLKAADIVKDLGIVQQLILYSTIKCDSPAERG